MDGYYAWSTGDAHLWLLNQGEKDPLLDVIKGGRKMEGLL